MSLFIGRALFILMILICIVLSVIIWKLIYSNSIGTYGAYIKRFLIIFAIVFAVIFLLTLKLGLWNKFPKPLWGSSNKSQAAIEHILEYQNI